MKLSITQARAQFSKVIEAAQHGERVVITRYGRPVAVLGPVRHDLDRERSERMPSELVRLHSNT